MTKCKTCGHKIEKSKEITNFWFHSESRLLIKEALQTECFIDGCNCITPEPEEK